MFTRASRVETLVTEIVRNADHTHLRAAAVKALFAAATVPALKEALAAMGFEFCSLVRHTNEQYTQIVYNALIRLRFAVAYTNGEDDLRRFPRADREVVARCAVLAAKPVGDLRLPPGFISCEVHAIPIAKYFQTGKLTPISTLQFIPNPVDALGQLHQAVAALAGFFSRAKPGPDQVRIVFLALFARDPPANAFSIARWLEKWDGLMLAPELDRAKAHFLAAVATVLPNPPLQ
jgi:hypothetical protein